MIKREILEKLIPITEEERTILDGADTVDKSIYTTHGGSVIRSKKFLSEGRLISVRAHTRFVHFPEHTHDFLEAVYMCSGETTHIINGKRLVLKEGELLFLGQNARQEILPAGGCFPAWGYGPCVRRNNGCSPEFRGRTPTAYRRFRRWSAWSNRRRWGRDRRW